MPTYVYRRADGTTFEHVQRITEDPLSVDPETGQPVSRVISGGVGVQFKGSGFYETDYVCKSGAPEKTESAPDAKSSDTAAAGSTDSASTETSSTASSTSADE